MENQPNKSSEKASHVGKFPSEWGNSLHSNVIYGGRNKLWLRNIKIRAQLRILKCIAIIEEATRKVLKHVY